MNVNIKRFFTSFIVLLVFVKVSYLFFEMFYNGDMLDTVTSLDVNKKSFEDIESFGHNLTSFGMTVLIAPFFYWLVRKIKISKYTAYETMIQVVVFLVLSIFLYSQIYSGLTKLMDYVIESQKEKRYESYYINTLKYGIISGKLGYGTFIPKRDNNEPLSIQEKVLLSNIFLLTHIDKTLIDRLITEGTEELIDVVISQYYNEEYQKTKKEFDDTMAELNSAWEQYQKAQLDINNAVSQKRKTSEIEKAYMDMHKAIDTKYNEYKSGSSEYNSKITKANTNKNQIYNDLVRYFKYKGNSKAERQYEAEMKKQFGRYISPSAWCGGSVCPSRDAIDKTIKEEANKAFSSKSQGVPSGLSREGFIEHPNVKSKVIEELKSKGMPVNNSFDYSPAMFEQAYLSSLEKNRNEKIASLKSRLENQGAINIKMGMTKEAFVAAFSDKINREISIADNEIKKEDYRAIQKGDKTSFYDYAYRPYFKQVVASKYILKQEDFEKPENKQLGDASIKMLYIPPFAVAMSLLAGGLNLVTLIALLITIKITNPKYKLAAKSSIILALMAIIIYMPYNKAINKNLLSRHTVLKEAKFESPWGSYINALNWIIVAETYNYQHVYSGLKSMFVNKSKNQWELENEKILNKSFIALSISLFMFGILITGCATSSSSQSQQAELIALNRIKFIPEVELFGEKIPLSQSQQYLLTSNQYSVELDSTEAGGRMTAQKGEQPFITFGRSSAPIYTVKFNKPSIVAEVHIIENMKMVTKSSKKGVVLLTLINDDKTRLQDVIFFTNKNRNMKNYSFGFKETVDVMSKELSLGSSNFFNEFYIGISSVYVGPLFDARGDILQITSPHTIKVFSIAKDDIYSVAEELLKKRNDREKNENLIRAIAQNDQTKYLSLYAQKNSFLLPDKSITKLPSDADPKYAVSNYDNIVNTGKYKTVQGKTEKMDLSAFSASKTAKEEKHSSNQQVETISALHKEPEKKVETKLTSKPVFSSTKEIEKIKLGEDNSSDGALGANATKKRGYVDLAEGAK